MNASTQNDQKNVTWDLVQNAMGQAFGQELHAKRLFSLSRAVYGTICASSLAVTAIAAAMADACDLEKRHALKQVDRLLSNSGLNLAQIFALWVPYVLGERDEIYVNFDWTDFDGSDQTMIVLGTQTQHGRSTPLLWTTVQKSTLKGKRNDYEDELLWQFKTCVPSGIQVTVVADRGFTDTKFFAFIKQDLGFEYLIRIRSNIEVEDKKGIAKTAQEWLGEDGHIKLIKNAKITALGYQVAAVVCVKDPGMKAAWFLATSLSKVTATKIKTIYGRRFKIEETFRDAKDPRYGLGLKEAQIKKPERRDRLFLIGVLGMSFATILGQAGEDVGLDKRLKATNTKKRMYSLTNQGIQWFRRLPTLNEPHLVLLLGRFEELLSQIPFTRRILGIL